MPADSKRQSPFEAPTAALRGHVTRGATISAAAQVVRLLTQIGSVVLLSRMLAPSEFGIVAMAAPVLALTLLFQEFGLTQAVVQKPEMNSAQASALFWISLGISAGFALLLLLVSPLVALFFNEPRVGDLTAAMAANAIITGAGAIHLALLNRTMRFGTLAILDTAAAVLGLAAGLAWAWVAPSFWAVFVASLVTAAVPAIGAWFSVGWIPGRLRRKTGAGAAVHFGAGVTGFNVANFFARNLDKVMIGRAWGDHVLGLYDRSYKLMLLPIQQINAPLSRVMLPALSRMTEEPDRYRHAFLRTMHQLLLLTLPGIAFMVASADTLVPTLLGPNWTDAAPIFAALGLAGLVQPLNNPCGWLFVSQGRTWEFMRWGLFNAVTCVIGFAIGLPYGALGVAVVYVAGEFLRTPLLWHYVTRKGPVRRVDAARLALPHLVGAGAVMLVVRFVVARIDAPWLALGIGVFCAYITAAITVSLFPQGREALTETFNISRRIGQRVFRLQA